MESTFDGGNTVPWYEHAPEHEDVYWPISWYFHCMQEQDILVNYDDHAGIMWHERWLRWQCSKLEGLINWCTSQARISSHHYEATALHWHHYSGRLSSTKWNALILRLNKYTINTAHHLTILLPGQAGHCGSSIQRILRKNFNVWDGETSEIRQTETETARNADKSKVQWLLEFICKPYAQ